MEKMKIADFKMEIRNFTDDKKVNILLVNEKLEDDIISIQDISTGICSEGNFLIDLTEETQDILIKHEADIFQRCLDNTPEELQNEETLNLLTKMFGYDKAKS